MRGLQILSMRAGVILLAPLSLMQGYTFAGRRNAKCQYGADKPPEVFLEEDEAQRISIDAGSREPGSCVIEFKTCGQCYLDLVFENFEVPNEAGNRTGWSRQTPGKSFCDNSQDSLIIQDFAPRKSRRSTVFGGDLSGTFFVSYTNKIRLEYCKEPKQLIRHTGVLRIKARKIRYKSCYHSIYLRHTCPDGSCTDDMRECVELPTPPPLRAKTTFIGLSIALSITILGVVICLVVLCCRTGFVRKLGANVAELRHRIVRGQVKDKRVRSFHFDEPHDHSWPSKAPQKDKRHTTGRPEGPPLYEEALNKDVYPQANGVAIAMDTLPSYEDHSLTILLNENSADQRS